MDIEKIIDGLNLPKHIIESTKSFFRTLLGSAVTETGELFSDKIKFLRFKNQVKTLAKAKKLLYEAGLNPKSINLKVLVPLMEYSSLEEDEEIQDTWANIIANIATDDTDQIFDLKCIRILSELTRDEILFLDSVFGKYVEDTHMMSKFEVEDYSGIPNVSEVAPYVVFKELGIDLRRGALYINRLISFGFFQSVNPNIKNCF